MKITLKKPISYDGKEYTEFDFDFEGLTGADILQARAGMITSEASYIDGLVPQLSMEFQARVAAGAAKIPYEVIRLFPAADFIDVTNASKGFLGIKG